MLQVTQGDAQMADDMLTGGAVTLQQTDQVHLRPDGGAIGMQWERNDIGAGSPVART